MSALEYIKSRRSYRHGYTERQVTKDELLQIIEAAYEAPSGCNLQTVDVIGILDPVLLREVKDIVDIKWAEDATAAVVLVCRKLTRAGAGESRYKEDFGAAAENLLVQVASMGLASCWIQGGIEGEKASALHSLLGVPDDILVMGYFPIGEPAKPVTPPKRKSIHERCFLDGYGKSLNL